MSARKEVALVFAGLVLALATAFGAALALDAVLVAGDSSPAARNAWEPCEEDEARIVFGTDNACIALDDIAVIDPDGINVHALPRRFARTMPRNYAGINLADLADLAYRQEEGLQNFLR